MKVVVGPCRDVTIFYTITNYTRVYNNGHLSETLYN